MNHTVETIKAQLTEWKIPYIDDAQITVSADKVTIEWFFKRDNGQVRQINYRMYPAFSNMISTGIYMHGNGVEYIYRAS